MSRSIAAAAVRFSRFLRSRIAPRAASVALGVALTTATACKSRSTDAPATQMTAMQADAAVTRAIRQSPEGFIFFPSKKAEVVYELPRLNEIAQSMRQPAAGCFLERAVQTMRVDASAEAGYVGVPDGQAKLRIRIAPSGKVLRTEVLETGFADDVVSGCVARALSAKRFPQNQTGTNHYIDVIYWVSLGAQPDDEASTERVRREQVEAGVRAKKCLKGRVGPGDYVVEALNLVARNGITVANRVEQAELSGPVRQCLATAFRSVRLLEDNTTFIRPVPVTVAFAVDDAGAIAVDGEEWLRVVKLEERARRALDRADRLAAGGDPATAVETELIDEGEPDLSALPQPEPDPEPEPKPEPADPGQGGLRLDIGPRGRSVP